MIERHAERYADEMTSTEALAAAARRRLAERVRRASQGTCAECHGPILARRAGAETCSTQCQERRKKRAQRKG